MRIAVLILAAITLFSCSESENENDYYKEWVGTWETQSLGGIRITFYADGIWSYDYPITQSLAQAGDGKELGPFITTRIAVNPAGVYIVGEYTYEMELYTHGFNASTGLGYYNIIVDGRLDSGTWVIENDGELNLVSDSGNSGSAISLGSLYKIK